MQVKLLPKLLTLLLVASVTILLFASLPGVINGQEPTPAPLLEGSPGSSSGSQVRPTKDAQVSPAYIVRLKDAPLASYGGDIAGLKATSPAALGTNKLNMQSAESAAYRSYLAQQRSQVKQAMDQALGHAVTIVHEYDVAFNGMAAILTSAEAERVAKLPGVAAVLPDGFRQATTTVSPEFIGATGIWSGTTTGGLPGTQGDGIIVGVIDTGIWPEHPSFEDTGYPAPPGSWGGVCSAPGDATTPITCTNKLIGAQYFLDIYQLANGGYDGLFLSARDDDGHGTHTASTAAGNRGVSATLLGVARGDVSGIAPRAYVAAYKALGPVGGYTSDLVAAINQAVADGVDVINYSIGGGASDPWADADSLAFLSARDAGVFVAVSASNTGPGPNTIGSPANAPWVTTVGASTSNRHYISAITLTGSISAPLTGLYGASVTAGVTDFRLVDAVNFPDSQNDTSGLCLNPFTTTTFLATDVVLCQRGTNDRVAKGDNVAAGSAGGVIVYNPVLQGLATDSFIIPAVHVENDAGAAIKDYLAANPVVTVTFSPGTEVFSPDPRVVEDMMAAFSSRGPNGPALDVIKPDVTAPGVQILAGASPQHVNAGAQGELFQSIQGTSMSSPHVAGAAALLKDLHPDWTPAEIQSALMSTALDATTVVKEDGTTPADPFDMGGGRIDLNVASLAGFVLDETAANYFGVDPFFGGDPTTLNQASLGDSVCVVSCSWTRVLSSTSASAVNWTVSTDTPTGMTLTASPSSFNLPPAGTQVVTFTADVGTLPIGAWVFAQVNFTPDVTTTVNAHFPVAVRPALSTLPDLVEFTALDDTGSYTVSGIQAVEITDLTADVYGLAPARMSSALLSQDSDNNDPFDDLTDGVFYITHTVAAGSRRLVAEVLTSEAPDLDMYVGLDDGDGLPEGGEIVCASASGTAFESCDLADPPAGVYWVLIQNWGGSGSQPDAFTMASGVVSGAASTNLDVIGPSSQAGGAPFNLVLSWDTGTMFPGSRWYGVFDLGTDSGNAGNLGTTNVNLIGPDGVVLPTIRR